MTDNNLGRDLPEVPDVPSPLSEPVPGPIEASIPPVPPPLPVPPVPPTPPVPPIPPAPGPPPTTSAMSSNPMSSNPMPGNPMGGSSLPPVSPPMTTPVAPPAASGYTAPPLPPPPAASPPLNPGGGTLFGKSGGGRSDLFGWLGFICGILATGCCCCPFLNGWPWLGGIPAIVLGFLHIQKVKKGQASASWLGWAAIALGIIAILWAICSGFTNVDNQIYDQYPTKFRGDY